MSSARIPTGVLMIAVPLVFVAGFSGLGATFDYPGILRHPAAEVLERFVEGGAPLLALWYAMTLAALGMIPIAVGMGQLFWKRNDYLAALSVGFGLVAGIVQALGLLRWTFLVPQLAAGDAAAAGPLFDAANSYLGAGVGEHLGYLFTALWTATVAGLIWSSWRWLAIVGFVLAAGVAFGMLEPLGVGAAVAVNALSFSAWALWVLVLGALLLVRPAVAAVPVAQAA